MENQLFTLKAPDNNEWMTGFSKDKYAVQKITIIEYYFTKWQATQISIIHAKWQLGFTVLQYENPNNNNEIIFVQRRFSPLSSIRQVCMYLCYHHFGRNDVFNLIFNYYCIWFEQGISILYPSLLFINGTVNAAISFQWIIIIIEANALRISHQFHAFCSIQNTKHKNNGWVLNVSLGYRTLFFFTAASQHTT